MYAEELAQKLKTIEKQLKELTASMKKMEQNCFALQKTITNQQLTISRLRNRCDSDINTLKQQIRNSKQS